MRADPLGLLSSVTHTYGDVISCTTGGQHIYLINRPELARQVLEDPSGAGQAGARGQRGELCQGRRRQHRELGAGVRDGMKPGFYRVRTR
jgi:hypothetical protein